MAKFFDKLASALAPRQKALSSVSGNRGGWTSLIKESFPGAWQRNVTLNRNDVLAFFAVFSCTTLIASDIAKLRIKLTKIENKVWVETENAAYSPVLRKPNHFQTRNQFIECWLLSKLLTGNAYILKVRDNRNVVVKLYVLDPARVTPLVSTGDGAVFYQIDTQDMIGLEGSITVPAREIIHDRYNCIYHQLVGISPLFASGLAASQGVKIQNSSAAFFNNNARPSGILSAPGEITPATAERLKEHWEANYTGESGAGKVAVLGDNLKFESMTMKSTDAQLVEQLQYSAENVCTTFRVPPYKVGIGEMPANSNVQALNVEYYQRALQHLIEAIEVCLDEGLDVGEQLGVSLDIDNLMRMDTITLMDSLDKASGVLTIDEKRAKLDMPPTEGGNAVYLQQQNYSLPALAKRDASDDPFSSSKTTPAPAAATPAAENDNPPVDEARAALLAIYKGLR